MKMVVLASTKERVLSRISDKILASCNCTFIRWSFRTNHQTKKIPHTHSNLHRLFNNNDNSSSLFVPISITPTSAVTLGLVLEKRTSFSQQIIHCPSARILRLP